MDVVSQRPAPGVLALLKNLWALKRMSPEGKKFFFDLAFLSIANVSLFFVMRYLMRRNDPTSNMYKRRKAELSKKVTAKQSTSQTYQQLQERLKAARLTEHEEVIASEIVYCTDDSGVLGFDDIGGLDHIIQSLKETVIFPLVYPHLFATPAKSGTSNLLLAPKGVLLYGPPGCGKTMLAKALARESRATFINLHVSTLTEKWGWKTQFGESQKLVNALFGLAKKLEPTIIFIDEIDSFLRERRSSDHETTGMMKAEFLGLWDGLASGENHRILVIGATNRPHDLDRAVLRRMPKRFAVKLPNSEQRKKILQLLLVGTLLDPSFDMDEVVEKTSGYSGSDLKELCREAAMIPAREYIRSATTQIQLAAPNDKSLTDVPSGQFRMLCNDDFFRGDGDDVVNEYKEGDADGIFEFEDKDLD